ncbi:MAG: MarP family serine protease [Acidimicrobiales bacterium]
MNLLDVLIVLIAVGAAMGGWRLGFLARVASWIGMGLGLYLAVRLLPTVVSAFDGAPQLQLFLVAVVLLVVGAFAGQALGLFVGSKLQLALPRGRSRTVDRTGGAVAGVLGVMVVVWLLSPVAAEITGWPADQVRNSSISRTVDRVFPSAPDPLRTLRSVIGDDRFPQVFEALRPTPDPGVPPGESGIGPEVAARVAASTVKVEAAACGRLQDGSGAVVGDRLIVTNAHVVAGAEELVVFRGDDGRRIPADLVAFDPNRDLAVLLAPEVDRPALPIADIDVGASGAVFGFPGGGELAISPFEVGQRIDARGTDIYDERPTVRDVFVLAAELRAGDSGAAMVNPSGEVVGVAFAIAPDQDHVAYALTPDEIETVLSGDLSGEVDAGRCL